MTASAQAPDGWRGILRPDERILWQGRPDQRFQFEPANLPLALFGVAFAGFALYWMLLVAQAGGMFWMFGLIHFAVGAAMVFGALVWPTFRRRRTWYTLTDQRAFIATELPIKGKRLDSYPIGPASRLGLRRGNPGTVIFATEARRGSKGRTYNVDIGFERIAGAEAVHGMIGQLQADAEHQA